MNGRLPPRAVVVTRATDYEELLARHGTREQARFFLRSRGQDLGEIDKRHDAIVTAVGQVVAAIPFGWRRARVGRMDLDRFLFEPEDVVVAVGQDGLVANVAKYLSGQVVVGVNPSRKLFDGVLVRHAPTEAAKLLPAAASGSGDVETRTMVEATTSDGQRLVALNEIFVGHRTHQSARYVLRVGEKKERQSSSGLIVATGTGASGWARSISEARNRRVALPKPTAPDLVFLVREAFPSHSTGTKLCEGAIDASGRLAVRSEMNDGGVAFGDGIEDDRLDFHFGQELSVGVARDALRLLAA